ncbi:MAG: NAD(P)-dependent oxidoreductase [Alphaproteobacteria bacterium]|nr:NAD(P)-dependent oxidoreductase [Alphaproteobacteria bacterium]
MPEENFRNHNVLVIGGAGYVGSVLVGKLLQEEARVRVLDHLLYDNGFALQHYFDEPNFSFVNDDFCDGDVVSRAMDDVTDVVLLGSLVGDPICKRYPELAVMVNRDASQRLVDAMAARGIGRFVFASTCSNYGIHDENELATEESELNPQSIYAETKIAVERYILDNLSDMPYSPTILRFATAYGFSPRMRFDLTVSHFASELAIEGELSVYDPDTWRPYCHIRDISKATMMVMAAPEDAVRGEVFNVGANDQQFTKRMIVEQALKHLGDRKVEYVGGDTDPRNYRVSFTKVAEQLGFRCDYSVERYVPSLIHAVRNDIFPAGRGDKRYGNYEIPDALAKAAAG